MVSSAATVSGSTLRTQNECMGLLGLHASIATHRSPHGRAGWNVT